MKEKTKLEKLVLRILSGLLALAVVIFGIDGLVRLVSKNANADNPEEEEVLVSGAVSVEVTQVPPTEVPVPVQPAAEEPVTEAPVVEEPVAEEPVAEELVAIEPVAEEPVAEAPVAEEPVAEAPVAEEPVAEEPVAEEPVAEEPVAEEPVAEEPVVEEPVAEEPVAEEPVAEEPVAEEPVVEEPVAEEPAVEETENASETDGMIYVRLNLTYGDTTLIVYTAMDDSSEIIEYVNAGEWAYIENMENGWSRFILDDIKGYIQNWHLAYYNPDHVIKEADENAEAAAQEINEETVTVEAAAQEITEETVTAEAAAQEIAEETATAEAAAQEINEETATAEAAAQEINEETATAEATAQEINEETATAEAAAQEIAEETATAEATVEEITEETATAEAAVEEIAEETATAEAAVEEIAEETATNEAAAQEIAEETATDEAEIERAEEDTASDETKANTVSEEDIKEEIDISEMRLVNVLVGEANSAKVYAAADDSAEVLAEVQNGAAFYLAGFDAVWAKIVYNNSYAYMHTADLIIYNAEDASAEEKELFRTVSIHNQLSGMPIVVVGMDISLTAELTGFEDTEYSVQWYYSVDGVERVEIPGANSLTYTFKVNQTNVRYYWFVTVTVPDREPAAD